MCATKDYNNLQCVVLKVIEKLWFELFLHSNSVIAEQAFQTIPKGVRLYADLGINFHNFFVFLDLDDAIWHREGKWMLLNGPERIFR